MTDIATRDIVAKPAAAVNHSRFPKGFNQQHDGGGRLWKSRRDFQGAVDAVALARHLATRVSCCTKSRGDVRLPYAGRPMSSTPAWVSTNRALATEPSPNRPKTALAGT